MELPVYKIEQICKDIIDNDGCVGVIDCENCPFDLCADDDKSEDLAKDWLDNQQTKV